MRIHGEYDNFMNHDSPTKDLSGYFQGTNISIIIPIRQKRVPNYYIED